MQQSLIGNNLENADIKHLTYLVEKYPWFSYARKLLLEKLAESDPEAFKKKVEEHAVFLPSRASLYKKTHAEDRPAEELESIDTQELIIPSSPDFFTKEDFDELDEGEKITDDFCTETLGEIYANQGHFDEAIEVFRKLILLYPQKNTYFASLIEKCEKQKEEQLKKKEN